MGSKRKLQGAISALLSLGKLPDSKTDAKVDLGPPERRARREIDLILDGSIIRGGQVRDHRSIDLLLRRGTITDIQHNIAEEFYKDSYVVRYQMSAIDLTRQRVYGDQTESDAYIARYVRYGNALRALPFTRTYSVTTDVCLEDKSIREVERDRKITRLTAIESLLAGLDILEDFYS